MMIISYVTYGADGALTGGYLQELAEDHQDHHIVVAPDVQINWTSYRANEDCTGVEEAPAPPPPPPALALSIPMLNLKLILGADGKLSTAESLFAAMEGEQGALARAYWTSAQNAKRDNYLVQQMWPALGYDLAGFNDAWARAAALNP